MLSYGLKAAMPPVRDTPDLITGDFDSADWSNVEHFRSQGARSILLFFLDKKEWVSPVFVDQHRFDA
jgi:hypothetical protein